MGGMGVGSRRVIQFGFSSSPGDQPLPTFEQLAMPMFDSLYNFARWLTRDSSDAEDLVQDTYLRLSEVSRRFNLGPISGHGCLKS